MANESESWSSSFWLAKKLACDRQVISRNKSNAILVIEIGLVSTVCGKSSHIRTAMVEVSLLYLRFNGKAKQGEEKQSHEGLVDKHFFSISFFLGP